MTHEKRDDERAPTFRHVELVTKSAEGEASFPIILRDSGKAGIGGVYVGQAPFLPQGDAVLRDAEGDDRKVQIIWTKKLAEYVHLVGLEIGGG